MKIEVQTNKTKFDQDHRLELGADETRKFVFPKFRYMKDRKFKVVLWTGKDGLKLHFKKYDDGVVKVGFEESGYGVTNAYYTIDQLENMMLPL